MKDKSLRMKSILTAFLVILLTSIINTGELRAQLIVTDAASLSGWTADSFVRNILLDEGVTISNAKFNGSTGVINCNSIGKFETGSTPTNLGIEAGLIIASGGVEVAVGPNDSDGTYVTTTCNSYSDSDLESIASETTYDEAVLEFDFIPWDEIVSFSFVFGSEEYMEYVNAGYNDVFGFFVDGANPAGGNYVHKNMALVPGTTQVVSIDNVNLNQNSGYYVDNTGGSTIQFDGFTTVIEVSFNVVPMSNYHIKMAICDAGDDWLDSGVFLEAHSFTTNFSHSMTIDEWVYTELPSNHYFCTNQGIEFNTLTNWHYDNVKWYFGDGTSAYGETVTHAYSEDGFYTVTNVIYNPHRETDSIYLSKVIEVRTLTAEQNVTTCDSYTWHGTTYTQSGTYTHQASNPGSCDSIVTLHLTINNSISTEENVTTCDSYTWHGTTYTQSGTYTHQSQTPVGCDSLVTLHLTISDSFSAEENVTACDSYTWHGTNYTQSGTYTHLSQTPGGCDSLITLHLNISDSYSSEETVTACNDFTWHGTTYTESGTYTHLSQTPGACDSTFVLNLTLGHDVQSDTLAFSCTPFTWHGTTYTQSGDYTYLSQTSLGCENLATLHLTIGQELIHPMEEEMSCDNSFIWHGHSYSNDGIYYDTITDGAGCIEVYSLDLTFMEEYSISLTETVCDRYPWQSAAGGYLTASGFYQYVGQTQGGCDSIINLNLTVNHSPGLKIDGLSQVAMTTDLGPFYTYYAIDTTGFGLCTVTWSCSNPEWILYLFDDTHKCMIAPTTLGMATLTATTHCNNGCDAVRTFLINSTYYDVDENGGNGVNLFPNPTNSQVTVQAYQLTHVKMFNNYGQTVKDIASQGMETQTVDVSDLPQGVYFVEITTTNGRIVKQLIITK